MGERVGIIGAGAIGQAVWDLFPGACVNDPRRGFDSEKAYSADFVFVCVPTPLSKGALNCRIVEEIVEQISPESIIVICSTLQPGTADRLTFLHNRRIVVQPEYYGETIAHPLADLTKQPFLILGGESEDVDAVIDLYKTVYNANIRIRKVSRLETEVIKLSENRAIAFKVAQCQELYDACVAADVDYNLIREAVYGDDPRFNLWWTFVYADKRGFNSKCIPKDVYAWQAWAESNQADTEITRGILQRNEQLIGEKIMNDSNKLRQQYGDMPHFEEKYMQLNCDLCGFSGLQRLEKSEVFETEAGSMFALSLWVMCSRCGEQVKRCRGIAK